MLTATDKKIANEDCQVTVTSGKCALTSDGGSSSVVMVSNSKDDTTSSSWSQYQQKQLEWALVYYPKFAKDRWNNIAKAVPGKHKVCTSLVKYSMMSVIPSYIGRLKMPFWSLELLIS